MEWETLNLHEHPTPCMKCAGSILYVHAVHLQELTPQSKTKKRKDCGHVTKLRSNDNTLCVQIVVQWQKLKEILLVLFQHVLGVSDQRPHELCLWLGVVLKRGLSPVEGFKVTVHSLFYRSLVVGDLQEVQHPPQLTGRVVPEQFITDY